jgi:hypothetical protein
MFSCYDLVNDNGDESFFERIAWTKWHSPNFDHVHNELNWLPAAPNENSFVPFLAPSFYIDTAVSKLDYQSLVPKSLTVSLKDPLFRFCVSLPVLL